MNYSDRIVPLSQSINTYLDNLLGKKYQIPTFQRDIVWDRNNVKKLWDSIFRFYPIGSILIWKTSIKLHNHRDIGGHVIHDDTQALTEYQYILDGQQRTTALLTSLYGGEIVGKDGFDPSLYVDLTVQFQEDSDDGLYKKMFLFWDEIDDKNGQIRQNIGRKNNFDKGMIVKINDVRLRFNEIQKHIVKDLNIQDFDHPLWANLRNINDILNNYRIPFIELKGIQVAEVCQIFERINQEGKPLGIFDIVVAKTYKPKFAESNGFYLRELIDNFRKTNTSNYLSDLDDFTFLQILAVMINCNIPNSGIANITDHYLNNIKSEQIEQVWENGKAAILKTFDFLENHLHLKGPQLIPYRYFYLTLTTYFYNNKDPDYGFLRQYFWYYSFHSDDLFSNTTQLFEHTEILENKKTKGELRLKPCKVDKDKLRTAAYSSKGRLSRAILSLLANQEPKDWENPDRSVLVDVYYALTDKPSLHHIFPMNYIKNNPGKNELDANSLMNIAYLTQLTNIKISDKNPLEYLKDFDSPKFENALSTHLIPNILLVWARMDQMPENALDQFIEARIDYIIMKLKENISLTSVEVVDTRIQSF